jgi:hypothetical protein
VKLYQLTPWARANLDDDMRKAIESELPADYLVHMGRGVSGWTCRILDAEMRVKGEAYGAHRLGDAFALAYVDMTARER